MLREWMEKDGRQACLRCQFRNVAFRFRSIFERFYRYPAAGVALAECYTRATLLTGRASCKQHSTSSAAATLPGPSAGYGIAMAASKCAMC